MNGLSMRSCHCPSTSRIAMMRRHQGRKRFGQIGRRGTRYECYYGVCSMLCTCIASVSWSQEMPSHVLSIGPEGISTWTWDKGVRQLARPRPKRWRSEGQGTRQSLLQSSANEFQPHSHTNDRYNMTIQYGCAPRRTTISVEDAEINAYFSR